MAAVQKTAGGNAAFHNFHNDFAHITDPNERRRLALAEIDKAPFGWYHIRAVVVAGIGFFTDAYDIFSVGMVTMMLGIVYFPKGKMPEHNDTAIKVATSCGTVVGQLGFGWLADVIGRKKIYGLELMIIIFTTLAQALTSESSAVSITGLLIFWRVLMGIGIGGDYPLSSVITSEFATTKWRGAMIGAVFAMQGLGQLGAALVAYIATVGFKDQLSNGNPTLDNCTGVCKESVDKIWRIVVGFGAVPACIALYYRLTIPETPRYTFDISRDIEKGTADSEAFLNNQAGGTVDELRRLETRAATEATYAVPKPSWSDFISFYSQWRFVKILVGTAGSWLVLDVAFYGLGLNNAVVLAAIGYTKEKHVYLQLYNTTVGNLILICAGAVPGYWFTVATVDTVGRKPIQFMGFFLLTILFFVIGFAFHQLSSNSLLGLYVLCQFFFNFGPNSTTFIVPGECFPTRYRSTSHGISAASGKIGAIIAQTLIGPLRTRGATATNDSPWLNNVMKIFAGFMAAGLLTTTLIPETKRKTLEQVVYDLYGEGEDPSHPLPSPQSGEDGGHQKELP